MWFRAVCDLEKMFVKWMRQLRTPFVRKVDSLENLSLG
jgi:hypothetical protein